MKLRRILALVLALSLCAALVACEKKTEKEPEKAGEGYVDAKGNPILDAEGKPVTSGYVVTVLDGQGNPAKGAIVRFMKDGTQVAMQVVNEQGHAIKELDDGTYTVELQFTDTEVNYLYEPGKVDAQNKQTTITLFNGVGAEQSIYAHSLIAGEAIDHVAYAVGAGSTKVTLTKGERNYFLFTPTEAGTYQFSLAEGEGVVGYYGQPFFVQEFSAEEIKDNAVSVSVRPDSISSGETGTTVLVIGVDAQSESGILSVVRTGDYKKTTADIPFTPYQTTHVPTKYTLPEGAKLTYVDIKGNADDYKLVMGQDGFYHLGTADGPLMLINFGKTAPNLSLEVMINGDGPMGGAPLRKYFFDEEYDPANPDQDPVDHLIRKEDYTEIMNTYFAAADENLRVYPLTADLEYMIKNGGAGWWTEGDANYIFDGCNPEIGWLFACCYIN